MKGEQPLVVLLMGPTASGKTALAEYLYKALDVDLISVDSALVYRGLNIGSAKPTRQELLHTPYHLIDICDPAESFSAGAFVTAAKKCIVDSLSNQRIPLLVGGTMMYFNRLINPLAELPVASPKLRHEVEQEALEKGWSAMHAQLKDFDFAAFQRIHPNDTQRIQRAIEVYRLSGKPISSFQAEPVAKLPYQFLAIVLEPESRDVLHQRIRRRLEIMFDSGFIDEVRDLHRRGDLSQNLPAIRSVGYRQVWDYLDGNLTFDELFDRVLFATRQLAKRQLTWLRRWPDAHRFSLSDPNRLDKIIGLIKGGV